MSYHQLTQTNRIEIAVLFRAGMSYRDIGKQVCCHHNTVSRELRRHVWHNPSGYNALQAKRQLAKTRLLANQHKRKLPIAEALVAMVTKRLIRNDSPQQIAGWMVETKQQIRVCTQTIYDWVYIYARHLLKYLHCRKGKYRRTRENTLRKAFRDKQKECRRITARPAIVAKRSRYGHWEGDTIVGKGHSGCIATFVERKSGYLMAVKLNSGTAKNFELAAKRSFAVIPKNYRKTLTLDNGTEMSNYEKIERSIGLEIYFA